MVCPSKVSSCVTRGWWMTRLSASIRRRSSANMNTHSLAESISRLYWPRTRLPWDEIPLERAAHFSTLQSIICAYCLAQAPVTDRTLCRIHKFNSRQHYWRRKARLHLLGASKRGSNSMTPQERQLVDDRFDRLSNMESAPRDREAAAAIAQGLRIAPNAIYPLVQTVLVQDEALRRANARIQELEAEGTPQQGQSGGFLDTMRGAIFGQGQPRGSVPNVPPPDVGSRPVWNSGQVMQQAPSPGRYDQCPYGQPSYGQPSFGQPYGQAQAPMGGGGSFLGTAAAAAAGMVGGSLLLGSIRSMMGGSHQAFGDSAGLGDRATSQTPRS